MNLLHSCDAHCLLVGFIYFHPSVWLRAVIIESISRMFLLPFPLLNSAFHYSLFRWTYHGPLTGTDPQAAVVFLLSIQGPHEGTDGSAADDVDRNACFIQRLQDANLGATPARNISGQATWRFENDTSPESIHRKYLYQLFEYSVAQK